MFNKISALREQFHHYGIDAYVVPSNDEFQNEYVPSHLKRLEWLTGFSGSNGVLIVTGTHLLFFTDSRYLLQAAQELSSEYEIFDMHSQISCSAIPKILNSGKVLGYDSRLHSIANFEYYQKLAKENNFITKAIESNLVDMIWHDKPSFYPKKIINLDLKYSGCSFEEKLNLILTKLNKDADYLLVTETDAICWLLNIRGNCDIEYSPLLLSYMLINKAGNIQLFTDASLDLAVPGLVVRPLTMIREIYTDILRKKLKVQLSKAHASVFFYSPDNQGEIILEENPILLAKACKNEVEIEGIKKAHVFDAVALCKFIYWLELNIDDGVSEMQAAEKLLQFRQKSDLFLYPSFATISAFADHGAIIHYHPTSSTDKIITRDNLYLLDSGGQYWCGTTDVTRTLCFGKPTEEQKHMFTLVLKGLIRLSMCIFPTGTNGGQLDSLARYDLWQFQSDYGHGTGHGVGHFLSVHEGPQGISKRNAVALKPGMILSNEPGYYKNGEYGIRIENLMSVREAEVNGFLRFDTLTLVPIAKNLIEYKILTSEEKRWLDHYHQRIKNEIQSSLSEREIEYLFNS